MARKKVERLAKLPNAPLVEVVFELRWKLYGDRLPPPLRTDPGLLPLLTTFTTQIGKLGYVRTEDMVRAEEVAGQSIIRRFRKAPDMQFPLMQIGSGIFASNDGPKYEWESYRNQVLQGVNVLLSSYPNLSGFPLQPDYLELRYVDVFDETLLQTSVLKEFSSRGTTMRIEPPAFLGDSTRFEPNVPTRVIFNATPQGYKDTVFAVDFGSAVRDGHIAFRLESKVVTKEPAVPTLKSQKKFVSDLEDWLNFARGLTSPFFKSFVTKELMNQFKTATS